MLPSGAGETTDVDRLDEAVRIAAEFPWAQTGCIEVRPVRDIETVRQRVYAVAGTATQS